jgi:inositol oxygenase
MRENPDYCHPLYGCKYGIYQPNCGIENLMLSFGHDEYMYRVLQKSTTHKLSQKYANIIRFHSFYPWHTGGEYKHFEIESDAEIKRNVLDFNQYDLYSKQDMNFVLTCDIKDYYAKLLNVYFPEPLCW